MKKEGKIEFWKIILYASGITIIIWALLKSFGVINSPIWIAMLPVIAGGVSILGATYGIGKIMENMKNNFKNINRKVDDLISIKEDFQKVKHNQALCINGKLQDSPYRKRY